jgi:hypothetical protein
LVANLAVKLFVQRFGCRAIEPNHLECDDRTAAALLRTRLPFSHVIALIFF